MHSILHHVAYLPKTLECASSAEIALKNKANCASFRGLSIAFDPLFRGGNHLL